MKMKSLLLVLTTLLCLLTAFGVSAQTETIELAGTIDIDSLVSRMVWNETGDVLTLVSRDSVYRFAVAPDPEAETYTFDGKTFAFSTVSEAGKAAMLSDDRNTIYIYDLDSPEKDVRTLVPGFQVLSVCVSKDGSQVLADSADKIRTVVYDAADGSLIHDLSGFQTAAPVYDSILSDDSTRVVWHSRGTFAVQNIADGSFGKTVSLWDFAAGYALSPDNSLLAVAMINDDYENGAVLFFDPVSGAEKGRAILGKTSPNELSFSDDGSVLWASDEENVYKIDPKTFETLFQAKVGEREGEKRVIRIASSHDGSFAAVLNNGGEIYLVTAK